jgi:hypothetical protein
MLRTRFTFAVAGAVAAVTLAITAVAFLVVRTDLQNQVREELAARRRQRQRRPAQLRRAHTRRMGAAALDRFGDPARTPRWSRRPGGLGAAGRPGC